MVKRDVSFAGIERAIAEQKFELCRQIQFVDAYEGKGIADNERSITIRLEYRSDERTLLEEEVETIHAQILRILETNLCAKQRL